MDVTAGTLVIMDGTQPPIRKSAHIPPSFPRSTDNLPARRRSQIDYTFRCWFPTWRHWTASYTTKGSFKARLRWIFTRLAILGLLVGIVYAARIGVPPVGVRGPLRSLLIGARTAILGGLDGVLKRI